MSEQDDDNRLATLYEDHDRLVRLEERVSQWMQSVDRRLTVQHQIIATLVGLAGTAAAGIVVALLTGGK